MHITKLDNKYYSRVEKNKDANQMILFRQVAHSYKNNRLQAVIRITACFSSFVWLQQIPESVLRFRNLLHMVLH